MSSLYLLMSTTPDSANAQGRGIRVDAHEFNTLQCVEGNL